MLRWAWRAGVWALGAAEIATGSLSSRSERRRRGTTSRDERASHTRPRFAPTALHFVFTHHTPATLPLHCPATALPRLPTRSDPVSHQLTLLQQGQLTVTGSLAVERGGCREVGRWAGAGGGWGAGGGREPGAGRAPQTQQDPGPKARVLSLVRTASN